MAAMRLAIVVVIAACGGAERVPRVVAPVEVPPSVEARPEEPEEPDLRKATLDLAFAGDVMFGRYQKSGFSAIEAENYDVFAKVAGILDSDFTMINLETPILRAPPDASPWGTRMRFVATPARVATLVGANVDAVTIANNHAWDMHDDGVRETPEILAELGLQHVGARRAAGEPVVAVESIEVEGWKLGFIAVTTVANWNRSLPGMPYVDDAQLRGVVVPVIEAGLADHHLVLVAVHWGTE